MFVWLVEALHETLLLLLPRQVKEELEDDRPLSSKVILEVGDVGKPLIPDTLAQERRGQLLSLQDILMYAHYEDLLIVRSVKDPDPSPLGQALGVAPEKVVVEVLRRGLLERENLTALRIYSRHDVLDSAVLPGRVHRLEHEQKRPAILGVEHILLLCEPLGAALQKVRRFAFAHRKATGVAGIEVLQFETLAFCNAERIDVFLDAIENFFSRHDVNSLSRCP